MLQLLADEGPQTSSYQGFAHGHHQGLPSPDPLLLTPAKFIISNTCAPPTFPQVYAYGVHLCYGRPVE